MVLAFAQITNLRRDLSMAFKERFVQVGFVFLLAIMALRRLQRRKCACSPSTPEFSRFSLSFRRRLRADFHLDLVAMIVGIQVPLQVATGNHGWR